MSSATGWKSRYVDASRKPYYYSGEEYDPVSSCRWHYDLPTVSGARKAFTTELKQLSKASFAAMGTFDKIPVVDVPGFGRLPLPLDEDTMDRLASFCEQAPFGKGTETVVDTTVRNVLQTDATNVAFANPGFQEELDSVFEKVRYTLCHISDLSIFANIRSLPS
jgi:hypothetical protein